MFPSFSTKKTFQHLHQLPNNNPRVVVVSKQLPVSEPKSISVKPEVMKVVEPTKAVEVEPTKAVDAEPTKLVEAENVPDYLLGKKVPKNFHAFF